MKFISIILVFFLMGCGFSPLYNKAEKQNPDGEEVKTSAELLGNVEIGYFGERDGQILHNALLDRINPRGRVRSSPYKLAGSLTVSEINRGVLSDGSAAIREISGSLFLTLTRPDGEVCFRVRRSLTFQVQISSAIEIDTISEDSKRRIILALADEATRLTAGYLTIDLDQAPKC